MAGNTVLFTHNVLFWCVCRNKKTVFLNNFYKSWASLETLQLRSGCWVVFLNRWTWKTKHFYPLYKPTKKRTMFLIVKSQVAMSKKGKILLIWKIHVTMASKDAYVSNNLQLQKLSSTFIHKNKSLLPATSILSRSSMFYKNVVSLDKLTCIDHVVIGKCRERERVGQFSWFT